MIPPKNIANQLIGVVLHSRADFDGCIGFTNTFTLVPTGYWAQMLSASKFSPVEKLPAPLREDLSNFPQ